MKLKDIVLTWDVRGDVNVFQRSLNMPLLGRWAYYSGYKSDEGLIVLMADFVAITVRDGCSPVTAHRAMMQIDEYRNCVAIDV